MPSDTSDYAIKVENLSKSFRIPHESVNTLKARFTNPFKRVEYTEFHALQNVSFEVKKGEFLGIIGRNGSGKSTLLKIIAGIYSPDSGKVKVRGKIVPFLELGVGFNPDLTARENVFLNGTILGMSRKYLESKYDEIMEFAEVKEFENLPVKNFSSGMYVRLAFSIAIQADADIFILDEILSVGDMNFQDKSKAKIEHMISAGKTVLFVSHDMKNVEKYSTRLLLLNQGNVEEFVDVKAGVEKYLGI